MKLKTGSALIAVAYFSYVLLGLPNGALGVAWPAIRESFGLPLDALGTLLTAVTIGYILVSFNSGRIVSLTDLGSFLILSSVASAAGLLGYALAPSWWIMVLFGLLLGVGAGAVDAGMNMYVAANYGPREMNWLHACFGIGVTLGPAMMTALINTGRSWRWGYAIIVLLQTLLAILFRLTVDRWRDRKPASTAARLGASSATKRSVDTLRLPLAWLGILIFINHTGVQFTAGQWAYSLFTEARAVAPATAGLWISIYWGSLTAGRLLLGPVAERLGVVPLLRICIGGIASGSALVWWHVTDLVSFLGLALIGLSVAPLFPSLISSTPKRVGVEHAANAIGFQVAAGSVGIALLPGFAGILAENLGLEIIGPFLVVASIVMLLLHEAMVRLSS
ncbi:MAG: MFS transporter [Anaerolineae bacterium]|jgi:fucose permease